MAFGRVCLTGDAAFVLRPHTGASTSKAATNAMELAKEVQLYKGDVVTALNKWDLMKFKIGLVLLSRKIKTILWYTRVKPTK